jgi:hypothetical protein
MEDNSSKKRAAKELIKEFELSAIPVPELEFTSANWESVFGDGERIMTPIGLVKMGSHQYEKMLKWGREDQFGMIVPTLTDPDIIIDVPTKAIAEEKTERPSSHVYVRMFTHDNRIKYYESITVSRDGEEIVISNHMADRNGVVNCMLRGSIIRLR